MGPGLRHRWAALLAMGHHPLALIRLLLVLAVLLPTVALILGGSFFWRETVTQADLELRRRVDIAAENAGRVFETHDLILREAALITAELSDEEVAANERQIHERLAAMSAELPQVLDVLVSSSDGHALASARRYPVPPMDIADRDFFAALRDGAAEPYVGALMAGRLEEARLFVVARRRLGPAAGFGGVVAVAVNPAYFERRYIETGLADASGATTMVLARSDNVVLARAPVPRTGTLALTQAFSAAVQSGAAWSSYAATSLIDGAHRHVLVHRIGRLPLYIVATVSQAAILEAFRRTLMPHMLFGAPATIALVGLVLLALRRTRQAEAERMARAEAEHAVEQAAKLESIGRLAAGIAHDFNNLLAAVIGSMEMAQIRLRDGRTDELGTLLTRGLMAARRGADLTKHMIAFARPSNAPPGVIDPGGVVRQLAELLPPLLGPRIAIVVQIDPDAWPVLAVPALLEATLMNLATNARDAMPEGGTLTIVVSNLSKASAGIPASLDRSGDWVRIAVSDTGHGFSEKIKARAFEPFLTTKDVGRGGGLGLAQVYAFGARNGGLARIEEPLGRQGATVALYLPRTAGELAEEQSDSEAIPYAARRILLVDDDREVLDFTAMALREAGHTVLEVQSAAAGLEQLRREDFDVLVVDYTMPGMTGDAMIAEARRIRPALPAIMISGQTDILAFRLPPDVYRIAKPFKLRALVRHIELVCARGNP